MKIFHRSEVMKEIRRRKRQERQANMEQLVNDMKRKQREAEKDDTNKKRQRSMIKYLAAGAGVVIGVFCVYVYSKIG